MADETGEINWAEVVEYVRKNPSAEKAIFANLTHDEKVKYLVSKNYDQPVIHDFYDKERSAIGAGIGAISALLGARGAMKGARAQSGFPAKLSGPKGPPARIPNLSKASSLESILSDADSPSIEGGFGARFKDGSKPTAITFGEKTPPKDIQRSSPLSEMGEGGAVGESAIRSAKFGGLNPESAGGKYLNPSNRGTQDLKKWEMLIQALLRQSGGH